MSTREDVRRLLGEGLSQREVARRLGITPPTVSYHARRLGIAADPRFTRRYDWAAVQDFYDAGNSVTACQERFGFARETWNSAVRRGLLRSRPAAMPLAELLVPARRGRWNIKLRLLAAGLKDGSCEACGIADWRGAPLTMALHHVNGDRHDNRLENLQLLCPNCHSQTENFAGRNGRGTRKGAGQSAPASAARSEDSSAS